MTENIDQTAAELLPPIACDPSAMPGELYSQEPEANITSPPDTVSTGQALAHTTTENTLPSQLGASIESPNQVGVDIKRSPIGNEAMCPSGTVGYTTVRPGKDPTKQDSARLNQKIAQYYPSRKLALRQNRPHILNPNNHPLP